MNRSGLKALMIITVLSTLVYLNALDNGFHYDDEHYILTNNYLEKWENIPSLLTTTRYYSSDVMFTGHYRPLLYVSYALNKVTGGNNPLGYHIVNLLFHICSAFFIFLIVMTIRGIWCRVSSVGEPDASIFQLALFSALIFSVHPFNSEVVNYITARSSVMSGMFYLMAFYFWIKYREVEGRRSQVEGKEKTDADSISPSTFSLQPSTYGFWAASFLSFILGMLTKEVVITLPLVLYLYDSYFIIPMRLKDESKRTFWNKLMLQIKEIKIYLPFIMIVLVPYLIIRKIKYNSFTVPVLSRDIYVNLLTETRVLIKYIRMLIFPVGQSVFHDIDVSISFLDWRVVIASILLISIGIIVMRLKEKEEREWQFVSFFSIWFFVTLLPTTIIPLNDIFQENRGYLAGISFAVIAPVLLKKSWTIVSSNFRLKISTLLPVLLAILIGIYSVSTFKRNKVWQDEYTLWSNVADQYPQSFKPYYSLGRVFMDQGDNEKAIEYFNRAIKIYPMMYNAYNRLGIIYGEKGESELAIDMFKRSIMIRPDFSKAYYNLGTTYYFTGNISLAVENYKKAIEMTPQYIEPYMALGEIYLRDGKNEPAVEMYRQVIYYKPSEARAYYRMGIIYEMKGEIKQAISYYRLAIYKDPELRGAKERLENLEG